MLDEYYEPKPLNKQNFRLVSIVCIACVLFILTKTFFATTLPAPLTTIVVVCEQLIFAWILFQLGKYIRNFEESPARTYIMLFIGIILIKALYITLVFFLPQIRYNGLMLLFSTLYLSSFLIIGKQLTGIANDFVGGLKYIGILFIVKSIIIFIRLLASTSVTYLPIVRNIGTIAIWGTELLMLFIDFAIFYILFKIFSSANLMRSK